MKWNLLILFDTYPTEDSTNVLMSPLVNLNTRTYDIPNLMPAANRATEHYESQ